MSYVSKVRPDASWSLSSGSGFFSGTALLGTVKWCDDEGSTGDQV